MRRYFFLLCDDIINVSSLETVALTHLCYQHSDGNLLDLNFKWKGLVQQLKFKCLWILVVRCNQQDVKKEDSMLDFIESLQV